MSDPVDGVRLDGPDGYWSTDKPPSRGQYFTIAENAMKLLRINPPKNRYEATIIMARLQAAIAADDDVDRSIPPL